MPTEDLYHRTLAALDSIPPKSGASIIGPDLTLLAERPPAPGGGALLVFLDPPPPPEDPLGDLG